MYFWSDAPHFIDVRAQILRTLNPCLTTPCALVLPERVLFEKGNSEAGENTLKYIRKYFLDVRALHPCLTVPLSARMYFLRGFYLEKTYIVGIWQCL